MNIKIYYFSGTGNTEIIANRISKTLRIKDDTNCELIAIDSIETDVDYEFDILGIGFPVYDFEPPEIVKDFIYKLKEQRRQKPTFIFNSYTSATLDCNQRVINELAAKNYRVFSNKEFKAPAAIISLYGNPKSIFMKNKFTYETDIKKNIDDFTDDIILRATSFSNNKVYLNGSISIFHNSCKFFSKLFYGTLFYRNLNINENCVMCLKCLKMCPSKNLVSTNNIINIKSKNGCMKCLKCIQACQTSAINFTYKKRRGNYTRKNSRDLFNM